jgi:hypothetical protein
MPEQKRGTRSDANAPLTQLKDLDAAVRAELYAERFERSPTPTNAQMRERILERFGIRLKRDEQLSKFWPWQWRQAQWDQLGDIVSQDEEMLADKFPHISRDRLRDATIKRMYALADLQKDPKLGLKVMAADLKDKVTTLDRDRFEFDAARACLARLPELKAISTQKGLSENDKVQQIRLKLFGVVPEPAHE